MPHEDRPEKHQKGDEMTTNLPIYHPKIITEPGNGKCPETKNPTEEKNVKKAPSARDFMAHKSGTVNDTTVLAEEVGVLVAVPIEAELDLRAVMADKRGVSRKVEKRDSATAVGGGSLTDTVKGVVTSVINEGSTYDHSVGCGEETKELANFLTFPTVTFIILGLGLEALERTATADINNTKDTTPSLTSVVIHVAADLESIHSALKNMMTYMGSDAPLYVSEVHLLATDDVAVESTVSEVPRTAPRSSLSRANENDKVVCNETVHVLSSVGAV